MWTFLSKAHVRVKFTVVRVDGEWLISNLGLEAGVTEERPVTVLAQDEAGNPIPGVEVTISNADVEIVMTEVTNDEGLATFEDAPAPDNYYSD